MIRRETYCPDRLTEGKIETGTGSMGAEGMCKWRQVQGREDRKKTVKGSQTTRMGEGGEIKPLTLVAVCGLLATLSASLP